tara:strand:- start:30405 stop:33491 length:3087 start_codon:yes stop_codon:yes gene_type:complete
MTNFLLFKRPHIKWLGFSILLLMLCTGVNAQITVSGTISEASGPIPGANVVLKGTTNGASADFDGKYTLTNIPSNGVLVISSIGYQTKEVSINNQNQINVILELDTSELDEVIVIGYGTQKKEAVTGSVISIKSETLNEVQSANFSQAIQGRAAGVELTQTSSRPGAGMQIRIRGTRSLSGSNDPLIVLNGIPFSGGISDINQNDIASIDILKDASATAIYGSRGANGVILITTKSGMKGQKAKFTYNSYYATKNVFAEVPMMNGEQFAALRAAAGIYTNGVDEFDNVNTNWQDLIYGTGLQTTHDMSVQGGGENGSFNIGMGYFKETSVLPGESFQRYSLRASIEQEVGAFRFGLNSVSNFNNINGGIDLYASLSASPLLDPYNTDGSLKRVVSMPLDDFWVTTRGTIDALGGSRINLQKDFGTYNNIFGEVKVPGIEGLKYRINLGMNLRFSRDGNFTGQGVMNTNINNPSSAGVSSSLSTDYVIENLLTYDRIFAEKHQVNFVGLFSAQEGKYDSTYLNVRNLPNEQFQFYNLGSVLAEDITGYGGDYLASGLLSYMARAMYQYDNRYMITATVRSDGSSRLSSGHKWVTYPAISIGWNIANEKFMNGIGFVNLLKLRAGYGQTSNQAITPYSTLGRLSTRDYNFGETFATGYYVSQLPSPSLGWEFSETYNYGLDFGLFNNRLSGTIEYYETKTNDILLSLGLPPTSGVSSYTTNIGKTENKGFEISLNGVIIDNPNGWSWEAGVNLYTNKNKLIQLADTEGDNIGNLWFIGKPLNVIYDYKKIGLWNSTDSDFQYLNQLEPGGNEGMIKVEYTGDYNPDGSPVRQINADDRQVMSADPDFQGGFNTRVAYKNFDLSMVGTFKSGGIVVSTLYSSSGYLNLLTGRRNNVNVDYWTPTNTDAQYPKPGGIQSGDNPKYGSTLGYFDASYLKVRTITLGYNFDQNFIKDAGLEKLRLYATVQNPFILFSPYHKASGMDIETNSSIDSDGNRQNVAVNTGEVSRGIATIGANVPTTRNYLLGLNITF